MITLFIAASLDGYIAGPKGEIDFLDAVNDPTGKEDYGFKAFYDTVEVCVMGRKTWEFYKTLGEWAHKGRQTWVLTRQKDLKPMADEKFSEFDPKQWRELARTKHVWLIGGGEINRLFLENNLVDKMVFSTVPVLLGQGLPCFPSEFPRSQWKLEKSIAFPSGLIESFYAKI